MRNLIARTALALLGPGLLAGCAAVAPQYRAPALQAPASFASLADGVTSAPLEARAWWESFGDPVLNGLIAEAEVENPDLRAAVQRLAAARARTSQAAAGHLPTGGPSVQRERSEPSDDEQFGAVDLYRAGFDVSWELDLFGRVRSAVRGAEARASASEATVADLRLTVAAEVARTYFELRGAESRARLLEAYIADQERVVELTLARVEDGAASEEDSSRARAQLAADRAALLAERDRAARLEHALAVLVGRTPGQWRVPPTPSLEALRLDTMAIGDPTELLRRRPDVRAAERRLAAATADVGVATAALFPQVRISGFFGYAVGSAGDLGDGGSGAWQLAPAISWPLFDLSRVRAGIRASEHQAQAALAEYERTVLRALADAENAVGGYGIAQGRLAALVEQASHARNAAELAAIRFEEGETDYLGALDAARTARAAEASLVEGLVGQRIATIAVHKALGGMPGI